MNVKPEQKHSEEPKPIAATSSQPCIKTHVVCRFISEWFMKRKLQKFEKEFDNYYTGLIMMGDLYDAKVRLLTYMKNNKTLYLKNYLENGMSVSRQIDEMLNNDIKPIAVSSAPIFANDMLGEEWAINLGVSN